jgi:hypothetical protein
MILAYPIASDNFSRNCHRTSQNFHVAEVGWTSLKPVPNLKQRWIKEQIAGGYRDETT